MGWRQKYFLVVIICSMYSLKWFSKFTAMHGFVIIIPVCSLLVDIKLERGKNVDADAVLCWVHHEKARFPGKDHNAGKGGRQQEKRKTKYKMDSLKETKA